MSSYFISIPKESWEEMAVQAISSRDREIYGVVLGRQIGRVIKVTKLVMSPYVTASDSGIYVEMADEEFFLLALQDTFPKDELLGFWHSHPWIEGTKAEISPRQISGTDKRHMDKGHIHLIACCYPHEKRYQSKELDLPTKLIGDVVCRLEGYRKTLSNRVRDCKIRIKS